MSTSYEKVAVVENEIEAGLLSSVLADRSIPHALRSYRDSAYDGIYQIQRGWGAVYAPAEFKNEILEILKDIRGQTSNSAEQDACSDSRVAERCEKSSDSAMDSARTGQCLDDSEDTE